MPNITSAGTFTKSSAGFAFLAWPDKNTSKEHERVILFAGSTVGTSCLVQYIDDEGVARTLEDGTISTLPDSVVVAPIRKDLQIVVTGTPSFNVTSGK